MFIKYINATMLTIYICTVSNKNLQFVDVSLCTILRLSPSYKYYFWECSEHVRETFLRISKWGGRWIKIFQMYDVIVLYIVFDST